MTVPEFVNRFHKAIKESNLEELQSLFSPQAVCFFPTKSVGTTTQVSLSGQVHDYFKTLLMRQADVSVELFELLYDEAGIQVFVCQVNFFDFQGELSFSTRFQVVLEYGLSLAFHSQFMPQPEHDIQELDGMESRSVVVGPLNVVADMVSVDGGVKRVSVISDQDQVLSKFVSTIFD